MRLKTFETDPKEVHYHVLSREALEDNARRGKAALLKGKRPVYVGVDGLLKVNTNIGVSEGAKYGLELEKLAKLSSLPFRPDSMMDHTIVPLEKPLWESMLEVFDGAVGTLPHYLPFDEEKGIDEAEFFENLLRMAEGGVSFMTLHPTADMGEYDRALRLGRNVPTTSRGGYVLLKDQAINHRDENIIAANFGKIMDIFQRNGVAVSVGTVFRPATIHEALDDLHREETVRQKRYIDIAKEHGVQVIMEGIGHISLDALPEYADLIRGYDAPFMPLGPMLSDEIIGFDHVTNALGALASAQTGVVGMINSVTREEHTGRVPSLDSVIEGLMSARVAAHCYNISRFPGYREETEVVGITRARDATCVQRGGIFCFESLDESEAESCSRCRRECPLQRIVV